MNRLHPYLKLEQSSVIIGQNVQALRCRYQISVGELSQKSGVGINTIGNLEGGRSNPFFATVQRLADALGVSVNRLAHNGEVDNA